VLITAADAASLCNVSLSYAREQIKRGLIKHDAIQVTAVNTSFGNNSRIKRQTCWLYDYSALTDAINTAKKENKRMVKNGVL
jgi:hypothetical protein